MYDTNKVIKKILGDNISKSMEENKLKCDKCNGNMNLIKTSASDKQGINKYKIFKCKNCGNIEKIPEYGLMGHDV